MKPTRGRPEPPSPPPPLEADDQLVIRVISAGWAVALVVLLVIRGSLPAGQQWWIWTCACGLALGFFGMWYVPRLKRGRARGEAAEGPEEVEGVEGPQSAPRDSGSNTVSPTDTPGSSTRS
jgi:hypothetical protein